MQILLWMWLQLWLGVRKEILETAEIEYSSSFEDLDEQFPLGERILETGPAEHSTAPGLPPVPYPSVLTSPAWHYTFPVLNSHLAAGTPPSAAIVVVVDLCSFQYFNIPLSLPMRK